MRITQATILSAIAVIGLIVLIAIGKVDESVGVPLIAALGGVHLGTNMSAGITFGKSDRTPPIQ